MRKKTSVVNGIIGKRRPSKIVSGVALLLAGSIVYLSMNIFTPDLHPSYVRAESTSESIDDAQEQKEEAQKKIDEARNKIDALKGDTSQLSADLSYLNDLNSEQKVLYEKIAGELEAALIAKQAALEAYLDSEANLADKKLEYSQRMSTMFEYQNKSVLEILLESDSIAGFFTNIELISLIGEADQQAVDTLKAAMDDAELKRNFAQQEAADMQEVADQKQAELDELSNKISNTQTALSDKQAELSNWQQKEDELNSASDALDGRIAELQQQLAAEQAAANDQQGGGGGGQVVVPNGSMTWPYPGDYTVWSPFGMRMHPVYGYMKMHTGVDLGGDYGSPIVAAGDGTVILVDTPVPGQNTGGSDYGNYLVIDHGNGIATLYGHCKDVYVSVGETVSAGQKVAACGSTGTSTGAHLHFEVRVNGQRVDPLLYIA